MIKLSLTLDTVNACLSALGKVPYDYAAPHINVIKQQAIPQVEALQKAEAAKAQQLEHPLDDDSTN